MVAHKGVNAGYKIVGPFEDDATGFEIVPNKRGPEASSELSGDKPKPKSPPNKPTKRKRKRPDPE